MAAGDPLISFTAAHYTPHETTPATFNQSLDNVGVLDFDDATDEYAYFLGVMSGAYDGTSAIDVVLGWKFSTYVGSQTCDWEAAWCRVDDDGQSIESLTFATAQVVLATEAGTTGELDYATIAFTNAQADGIQPNEMFVLRVMRDSSGGTASPGDAELAFINVVYGA